MSLSSDNEGLNNAFRVRFQSALYRRRARALFELSAAPYKSRTHLLIVATAFIILLLVIASKLIDLRRTKSHQEFALPLVALTRVNQLDRLTITHTIRDGDTLWRLSVLYYGSYSRFYQQRLRNANPWLPDDPRQLKIGLTLKIPVM